MASKEVKFGGKIYTISYEMQNLERERVALFLHGWGANKEIMKKAFGSCLREFKHIYVDMPGFGASSMHGALHTKDYAKIMQAFLSELGASANIIVGHSFGGKVATLLNPENLVLLSSAGIVVKKPVWVRFKIVTFKFLKIFGLGFLYRFFATKDVKGMSKTMYETLKNVVDEDFSAKFAGYKGRAFIFWGEEDRATPVQSGERIGRLIANSEFHALKGDHFFFLLHARYIDGVINSGLNLQSEDDTKSEVVVRKKPQNLEQNLDAKEGEKDENLHPNLESREQILEDTSKEKILENADDSEQNQKVIKSKTTTQASLFEQENLSVHLTNPKRKTIEPAKSRTKSNERGIQQTLDLG